MRGSWRSWAAVWFPAIVGLTTLAAGAWAQQTPSPMRRAVDLERRGNYVEAAAAYRDALKEKPTDASALLGLERALLALDRTAEVLPEARAAIAASPRTTVFYAVALRGWAAAGQPDSVRAVAERWAELDPTDESPYREWGEAALGWRDRAEARRAYTTARERLHRPDALAPELAMLLSEDQDWTNAAREWAAAVSKVPAYHGSAARALAPAPENVRGSLLGLLASQPAPGARWLESDLRARWGDPVGAFQVLSSHLPPENTQAAEALTGFLDQLREQNSPTASRAQALALSALAERAGGPVRSQLKLQAAQAFAEAGDEDSARKMLSGISGDPGAVRFTADAATALISVLLRQGKVEEAARKLEELKPSLASEDWLRLRRSIAWGWVRAGRLDSADAIVARDSSVEGLALAGRLRLLHGEVDSAAALLKLAGPYAGTREDATERTALLALLEPIQAESLPALGTALLALERGDTARGLEELDKVATGLPADGGAAEIRLYAGKVAQQAHRSADAERLFRAAAVPQAKATAPAASLALAQLLIDANRSKDAAEVLEHLILGYPDSALLPQARRLLDQARGGVPKT